MDREPTGRFVRGEISSTDASAGVLVSLFDRDGAAFTLGAQERLTLYELIIVTVAGGNVALTGGATITDVAGSRLVKGTFAANSGVSKSFRRPIILPKAQVPKLFADAGQVNLSAVFEVVKA